MADQTTGTVTVGDPTGEQSLLDAIDARQTDAELAATDATTQADRATTQADRAATSAAKLSQAGDLNALLPIDLHDDRWADATISEAGYVAEGTQKEGDTRAAVNFPVIEKGRVTLTDADTDADTFYSPAAIHLHSIPDWNEAALGGAEYALFLSSDHGTGGEIELFLGPEIDVLQRAQGYLGRAMPFGGNVVFIDDHKGSSQTETPQVLFHLPTRTFQVWYHNDRVSKVVTAIEGSNQASHYALASEPAPGEDLIFARRGEHYYAYQGEYDATVQYDPGQSTTYEGYYWTPAQGSVTGVTPDLTAPEWRRVCKEFIYAHYSQDKRIGHGHTGYPLLWIEKLDGGGNPQVWAEGDRCVLLTLDGGMDGTPGQARNALWTATDPQATWHLDPQQIGPSTHVAQQYDAVGRLENDYAIARHNSPIFRWKGLLLLSPRLATPGGGRGTARGRIGAHDLLQLGQAFSRPHAGPSPAPAHLQGQHRYAGGQQNEAFHRPPQMMPEPYLPQINRRESLVPIDTEGRVALPRASRVETFAHQFGTGGLPGWLFPTGGQNQNPDTGYLDLTTTQYDMGDGASETARLLASKVALGECVALDLRLRRMSVDTEEGTQISIGVNDASSSADGRTVTAGAEAHQWGQNSSNMSIITDKASGFEATITRYLLRHSWRGTYNRHYLEQERDFRLVWLRLHDLWIIMEGDQVYWRGQGGVDFQATQMGVVRPYVYIRNVVDSTARTLSLSAFSYAIYYR